MGAAAAIKVNGWTISAESSEDISTDPVVWLHIATPGLSGGRFLSQQQARQLAAALVAAADDAARRQVGAPADEEHREAA